jgi:hypothetical protein
MCSTLVLRTDARPEQKEYPADGIVAFERGQGAAGDLLFAGREDIG